MRQIIEDTEMLLEELQQYEDVVKSDRHEYVERLFGLVENIHDGLLTEER